jgi:hypothetical protein
MKSASDSAPMASSAEFKRLAELIDQHAACMWSMALCFFEDLDAAEEVVAALLASRLLRRIPWERQIFVERSAGACIWNVDDSRRARDFREAPLRPTRTASLIPSRMSCSKL